jgi:2-succinyl-5-enolpyruvyl-6-hydroxy-3-cyclohexene-1-carboxylate synthase
VSLTVVDPVSVAVRAFVEELVSAGLRDIVSCPGSRSTPLALAFAAHEGLRTHVLLDERSAGFVALGMARAARRPAAVLVTSGTAAAELMPAVVEASLGRVPLLILTADRPPELRDRGAPQTIDQVRLFGRHVTWDAEVPLADGAPGTLAHVRWLAGRAMAEAASGPRGAGPVHVDFPFREPLVPNGPLGSWSDLTDAPYVRSIAGKRALADDVVEELARRLADVERGLIIAGPSDDVDLPEALASLAAITGYPIAADPLSGLRAGDHDRSSVLARADQLARPGAWIDAHLPDLIVRVGAMPTSRAVTELLARERPELWVIDGDLGWRESALVPALFLHADAPATARAIAVRLASAGIDRRGSPWARDWSEADARVDAALGAWLGSLNEPFEGLPFALAPGCLPDGAVLWAGSSMPVRDLDGWLPSTGRSIRVLADRGANGIDGLTSAALGSALVAAGPVVLVTGDVSFLHDLGALVSARILRASLTVVLVNNDGGGIFSFLPQASTDRPFVGLPERFERLLGTPHGLPVGPSVEALGFRHERVDHRSLAEALSGAVAARGLTVLELRTDRSRNVELHHDAARVAAAALTTPAAARSRP